MKKIYQFLTGLSMAGIFVLGSCSKHESKSSAQAVPPKAAKTTIQQTTWKVTHYDEDGTDDTRNFEGYAFSFNSNGNVVATQTGNNVQGTWSTSTDDDHDKLLLNFGNTSPFEELNEDWHILALDADVIDLQHKSGGNGSINNLTFRKN